MQLVKTFGDKKHTKGWGLKLEGGWGDMGGKGEGAGERS